jgi:hypothetical protein
MKRILSVTAVGIALAVATTALAGPAFAHEAGEAEGRDRPPRQRRLAR